MKALRAAFPYTLPILAGYGFLGMTKGIYMSSVGLNFLYSLSVGIAIFGGSVEFLVVSLLITRFDPVSTFIVALMLSARQIFYSISMLDVYKGMGLKKYYLIYALSDETFAVNYSADIPPEVDRGWFMLFVSLLNQIYWLTASTLGGILGDFIPFSTEGIDFVMTAMFVVIFLNQWMKDEDHTSALTGLLVSALCLALFGADGFIIPAMALILFLLSARQRFMEKG